MVVYISLPGTIIPVYLVVCPMDRPLDLLKSGTGGTIPEMVSASKRQYPTTHLRRAVDVENRHVMAH